MPAGLASLVPLVLSSAIAGDPPWDKPWPKTPAPSIQPEQLAELHRHPVDLFHCPESQSPAFAGLNKSRVRNLLGAPDPNPKYLRAQRDSSWRYYVTHGRDAGIVGPGITHNAYFQFWFEADGSLGTLSCTANYAGGGSQTWNRSFRAPEPVRVPRRDPAEPNREIEALLYSSATQAQMLAGLEKFLKLGGKRKRFERRTGIQGICVGSGPGYMHCL